MAINFSSFRSNNRVVENPPFLTALFNNPKFAPIFTVIRILIGLSWLQSGLGKFSNPAWMETGTALQGFWERAVIIPETGKPAIAFDWYRGFLQGMLDAGSYTWFAKLIVLGEIAIGFALIIGAFVGIAALFAAFMNWNFIMAGSASTNGLLLVGALTLVIAWKTAGYLGADYFIVPLLAKLWGRRSPQAAAVEEKEFTPAPGLGD
jgi:thiosulfate dehydrogenase [quinone] large subunit